MKFVFVNTPDYDSDGFLGAPTSLYYACSRITSDPYSNESAISNLADIEFFDPPTLEDYFCKLPALVSDSQVGFVGFSNTSHSRYIALRGAKIVRDENPNCIIAFGGPHEDETSGNLMCPNHTLNKWGQLVDVVICGDGEYSLEWLSRSLVELAKFGSRDQILKKLKEQAEEVKKLQGKGYLDIREGDSYVRFPLSQSMLELDNQPFINWTYIDQRHFNDYPIFYEQSVKPKRTAQVMTHRGCRGACRFCTERRQYNRRSNHLVVEEIERLKTEHEVQSIFFDDSTFNDEEKDAIALCKELERSRVEWGCLTRFDKVDVNALVAMKKAGCSYVYLGLEQFDDEVLRKVGKQISTNQIIETLANCHKVGIRVGVSTLFGIGESRDVAQRTIEQVGSWCDDGIVEVVSLSANCYHPGSFKLDCCDGEWEFDYDRKPPYERIPWTCFEEGLWYHPKEFDEDYAHFIVGMVSQKIPPNALARKDKIKEAISSLEIIEV